MSHVDGGGRRSLWLGAAVAASVAIAALGIAATRALASVGFTEVNPYASSQFAIGASATFVGAFIAHRRPEHPIGWLLLVAGFAVWCTFAGAPGIGWLMFHRPGWEAFTRVLLAFGVSGWLVTRGIFLTLIPLAFPDGFGRGPVRRALRWASTASIATVAVAHSRLYTPEYFDGQPATGTAKLAERVEPWAWKAVALLGVACIGLMLARAIRPDRRANRGELGFAFAVAVLLVPTAVDLFNQFVHETSVDLSAVETWTMFALPLVLAVGIVSRGALGIDVIIRKATLYAGVAVVSAAIYLSVVWAVAAVRPDSSLAPVIGAGAVAVTLGFVRDSLQRLLARRLFGSRDDPYQVLAALGTQMEAAPVSEHALQAVTDTVCDQLRLPFAAVDIDLEEARVRVAATGSVPDNSESVEHFALAHQGVALGDLVVARRTQHEPLTDGEGALLSSLARQAGVLAHNVTLVEALRRSRVVLLNAREEERRRIRADLHDGLGPTLATVAMGLEASSNRLRDEPELAALLADLEAELQVAIRDVRTLVYDLRPAALDDLGLISAVREHANNLARRSVDTSRPLQVSLDAPETLGPLPAAVEVAAYRVALEALTNVARHARASTCSVRLREDDGLEVTVADDGIGLDERHRSGIGLQSMHDRVTELGGTFEVDSRPGLTEVRAWFPLLELSPA